MVHYNHRKMGRIDFKPLYMRLLDEKAGEAARRSQSVSIFEEGFGRPLSSIVPEFSSIPSNAMVIKTSMIIDALHEEVKAQVLNFRYIEKILENWEEHGVKKKQNLRTCI